MKRSQIDVVDFYKKESLGPVKLLFIEYRYTLIAVFILSILLILINSNEIVALFFVFVPGLALGYAGVLAVKKEMKKKGIESKILPNWEDYNNRLEDLMEGYLKENNVDNNNVVEYLKAYIQFREFNFKQEFSFAIIAGFTCYIGKHPIDVLLNDPNITIKTYLLIWLSGMVVWLAMVICNAIIKIFDINDVERHRRVLLLILKINQRRDK